MDWHTKTVTLCWDPQPIRNSPHAATADIRTCRAILLKTDGGTESFLFAILLEPHSRAMEAAVRFESVTGSFTERYSNAHFEFEISSEASSWRPERDNRGAMRRVVIASCLLILASVASVLAVRISTAEAS